MVGYLGYCYHNGKVKYHYLKNKKQTFTFCHPVAYCVRPGQVRIPTRPRIKIKNGLDGLALDLVYCVDRDNIQYGFACYIF